MQKHLKYFLLIGCLAIIAGSCKKGWLDAKPDKKIVAPSTLEDYQAVLDNTNEVFNVNQPGLGEIGSGDFYLLDNNWSSLYTNTEKNAYTWAKDIYEGETYAQDWPAPYQQVFNADVVLEGLANIPEDASNKAERDAIKGSSLFYRAYAFYVLAQEFAKPYDKSSAATDPGIPLRLSSDVTIKSVRATVEQTYNQIIGDLKASIGLLQVTPKYKTRPSKPGAYAMLARTCLSMNDYANALLYADSCLQLSDTLIDFDLLDTTTYYPIPPLNVEDLFNSTMINYFIFDPSNLIVDSLLYQSYDTNDLRRRVYFKDNGGHTSFRGSYSGNLLFGGLATDEVYLIRAECYARAGNAPAAMQDLNHLLKARWDSSFTPLAASDADDALRKVLTERRKELVFRGLRWTDLRRLNMDPRFADTLTRVVNGQTYTLLPGSQHYVLPIPDNEIEVSGIQQNPR